MDSGRQERIKRLFLEGLELDGPAREALLAAATSAEREEVRRMLDEQTQSLLKQVPIEDAVATLDAAAPVTGLRAGQRFGRYEIQREIGSGGGGQVYLATDTQLKRQAAIKILKGSSPSQLKRFTQEAISASSRNHPNIVTVYDAGSEDGISYIAMEYIAGKSLRSHIRRGSGMPLEQFFDLAIPICDGLAAAHKAGLVHRDLKPGNIMVTERGVPKIVDFGLAKGGAAEKSNDGSYLTVAGLIVGTPGYMAPEQAKGAKDCDARVDIFALGCIFYEMVSGRKTFSGNSGMELIAATLDKEPEPVHHFSRATPKTLETLIGMCLRKNPDHRLQSAADIKLTLEELRRNPESNSQASEVKGKWAARKIAASALAAGCALTAGLAWYWNSLPRLAGPTPITTIVTTDSGLSAQPSLSSDGRLMVYASDRGAEGNLDIWLQQIGGGAPVRLTSGPEDETTPDISPDATRVVFRSEKDGGGIFSMPVLGGDPVLLAKGGHNPRVSPDGNWVTYWVGRENSALMAGVASVYAIPSRGGQPRHLSRAMAAAMYPAWSPDGSRVLAVARREASLSKEPKAEWWTMPLDPDSGALVKTGALAALANHRPQLSKPPIWQSRMTPIAWRTNGNVVFSANVGDTANLWQIRVDPQTGLVDGSPEAVTTGAAYETEASFAQNALKERIAFSALSLHFDLWGLPVDAEWGQSKGEPRQVTRDASYEFYPSVSADGTKLSFITSRGNSKSLCILDLRTNKETVLLSGPGFNPRISGDGKWIVFIDEQYNVLRVAAAGGGTERLCTRCGTPTDFDATGASVLLESEDSPESVLLLDVATKQVSTLVPARERLFDAKFSRDGQWVVFHAMKQDSPAAQIFVARVEPGKTGRPEDWIAITDAEARNQSASWSPGGNAIYFLSERDGFRCVWSRRVHPVTKQPQGPITAVRHFHHARQSLQAVRSFDSQTELSLTKDQVVVVVGELTGNVWLRERDVKK